MVEFPSTLSLSAVVAFSVLTFDVAATPPADEPSRAKAREDAEFLVDGVESSYDCKFELEAVISRLDSKSSQPTFAVRLAGSECAEAFRALQLRSLAFPFRLIELPAADSPKHESRLRDDT